MADEVLVTGTDVTATETTYPKPGEAAEVEATEPEAEKSDEEKAAEKQAKVDEEEAAAAQKAAEERAKTPATLGHLDPIEREVERIKRTLSLYGHQLQP